MATHNEFRSIVTTPAATVASEHLMLELARLQAKSRAALEPKSPACDYLADLQKQLEAV